VKRAGGRHLGNTQNGSLLLEAVVAASLVSLLIAFLATPFARTVKEAETVRQQGHGEPAVTSSAAALPNGDWGRRVINAWWRPGPVLHVRVSGDAGGMGAGDRIGLWADGWLVAEEDFESGGGDVPGTNGEMQVGPQLWAGLTGSELVIRVRVASGAWGPPWRLDVPEPGAGTPTLSSAAQVEPQGPTVLIHRPEVGTSSLAVSWSTTALTAPPFSLLFSLAPALQGWGGVTLGGRSQWWWMEEGRSADLYY
jgi:hypothetical protein